MNWIDLVLVLPFIYGFYEGFQKGFVLMILGFISLIVGLISAFKLVEIGLLFILDFWPTFPKQFSVIAFLIIFLLVTIGVYFLGMMLKQALNFTVFAGNLDKVMGGIFGLIQWIFMVSLLLWLLNQSQFQIPTKFTANSFLYKYLDDLAVTIINKFEFILPYAHNLMKEIKQLF